VKLSVPPPVFVTVALCAAGFAPPCTALMLSVVGDTDKTAGGTDGATVRVTATVNGEPWAPGAVTVKCPVYVPAVRLPTAAET
jgi:hypothetical protein